MRAAGRDHAAYRELISGRLDETLDAAEEARLIEHLVNCGRCRATERAYRAQRQQLRAPARRPALPPRDLWATTSTALDREVAGRGGYVTERRQLGHFLAGGAAVASVAAIGLSLGLMTSQLPPAETPSGTPAAAQQVLRPTPFTVPAEALAFLGSGAEGLAVYRTRVDRVCPAAAIDCVDYEASAPAIVRLPRTIQPSNLALSPNGGRLAIEGRSLGGENVIAVVVMPDDELARQPSGPRPSTDSTPLEPSPALSMAPSPTLPAPATPATLPPFSPMTEGPSATATATAGSTPAASVTPAASPQATASPRLDGAGASPSPDMPTASPLPSDLPEEQMQAILDEVRSVGAPAAWSGDGSALAFSAMPADLSRGPDVYIWRPGDERAQPLTRDHGSYFASWAGSRVVVSRVVTGVGDASDGDQPAVATVVIDPLTGEERTAEAGAGLWLPAINPLGTKLVAWHGSLRWATNEVEPLAGGLYVADWTQVDPFAGPSGMRQLAPPDAAAAPETDDEPAAAEQDEAATDPAPAAVSHEPAEQEPPAGNGEASTDLSDEHAQDPSADPTRSLRLVPVHPERDTADEPVQDWQTRWSPDGNVLAVWIADVPGASWGQLTVMALDAATDELSDHEPLLGPSLARRAFTLGSNRVAWVAPADGEPQGELRVRTWGPDGFGDLRLRPPPLRDVVPAS